MIIALSLVFVISACEKENEEEKYAEPPGCDTANVTYSGTVLPILQTNNCISCHNDQTPSGGIKLATYDDVAASAAIQPGDYGSLYGSIAHLPGNSPMPKNAAKLSDCDISKIKAWIDTGYPNN